MPRWIRLVIGLMALALAPAAWANKRPIRVDGFGDTWTEYAIPNANCPGASSGATTAATLVTRFGFTFSGRANTAFLVDVYCQVAQPAALTESAYYYSDEDALAYIFGDNVGDKISGIRYAFLDHNRFDFENPPTGFQWAFYSFPWGVTLVSLYGFQSTTLDSTSYISPGVWSGQNGYNGEYFCFRTTNNTYIGSWNGLLTDTGSACLHALQERLFGSGFDR